MCDIFGFRIYITAIIQTYEKHTDKIKMIYLITVLMTVVALAYDCVQFII